MSERFGSNAKLVYAAKGQLVLLYTLAQSPRFPCQPRFILRMEQEEGPKDATVAEERAEKKVPVSIVTGFLGSGKVTMHILFALCLISLKEHFFESRTHCQAWKANCCYSERVWNKLVYSLLHLQP